MNELGKKPEISEFKTPESQGFKEIKPESGSTFQEATDFINGLFNDLYKENHEQETGHEKKKEAIDDKPEHFKCINEELAGKTHPETGVPFEQKVVNVFGELLEVVVPRFDSKFDAQLPKDLLHESSPVQNKECNAQLRDAVSNNPELRKQFTPEQLEQIDNGDTPDGYTWHHDAEVGKMQLVDTEIHMATGHTGGRAIWADRKEDE